MARRCPLAPALPSASNLESDSLSEYKTPVRPLQSSKTTLSGLTLCNTMTHIHSAHFHLAHVLEKHSNDALELAVQQQQVCKKWNCKEDEMGWLEREREDLKAAARTEVLPFSLRSSAWSHLHNASCSVSGGL
jgi:hypothetical protein